MDEYKGVTKDVDLWNPRSNSESYIGGYGDVNTYTADLPEGVRNKKMKIDSTQRVAHVNPNNFNY